MIVFLDFPKIIDFICTVIADVGADRLWQLRLLLSSCVLRGKLVLCHDCGESLRGHSTAPPLPKMGLQTGFGRDDGRALADCYDHHAASVLP